MALGPTTGPDPLNESVLLPAFRVQAPGTALPPLTVSTSFSVGVAARVGVAAGVGVAAPVGVGAGRWCRTKAREAGPLGSVVWVPPTADASTLTTGAIARATSPPMRTQILRSR
jgi:hypothetical protein